MEKTDKQMSIKAPYIIETGGLHLEIKPTQCIDPESRGWVHVDIFKRGDELLKWLGADAMPVEELRRVGRQIRTYCDTVVEEK